LRNNAVASHVDAKEEVIVSGTRVSLLTESAQRSRQDTQAWQKPFRDVEVNGPVRKGFHGKNGAIAQFANGLGALGLGDTVRRKAK
jgi:hypothetical protein